MRLRHTLSLLLLLALAGGVVYWWRTRPASASDAQSAVTEAARTGDYASVGRAVDAGKLSREEVRAAVREEFERQTLARINSYFDTTDANARRQVLDKAIDDLERFRAEARKRAPTTAAAADPNAPQPEDPRLAMAAWALSQPPATRARIAEFRVAMDKRRAERGLPGLFDLGRLLPLGGSH